MASSDFTIADVLAWARTKPADEAYDFQFTGGCALCQFLADTGRAKEPWVTYRGWGDARGDGNGSLEESLNSALGYSVPEEEWSFGALVVRLEALCPTTILTQRDWAKLDAYLTDIESVPA